MKSPVVPRGRGPLRGGTETGTTSPVPGPSSRPDAASALRSVPEDRLGRARRLGHVVTPERIRAAPVPSEGRVQRAYQYEGNVFDPSWVDTATGIRYRFDRNGPSPDDVYVRYIWVKPETGGGPSVAIRLLDPTRQLWDRLPDRERKELDEQAWRERTPDVVEEPESPEAPVKKPRFQQEDAEPYPVEMAEVGLSEAYKLSKLKSSYTAHATVLPLSAGQEVSHETLGLTEQRYLPSQVWVRSIVVSDEDRPETRFEDQESHTVAWTLVRKATMALAPRTASELLEHFEVAFENLSPLVELPEAQLLLRAATAGGILTAARGGRMPLDRWQELISNLVQHYAQVYQMSTAATYRRGRAKGHGEATAMQKLQDDEDKVQGNRKTRSIKTMAQDAAKLLDVQFRLNSLGLREYAFAVRHWIDALATRFPRLMAKHGDALVKPMLDKKLAPSFKKAVNDPGVETVRDLMDYFEYETRASGPGSRSGGIEVLGGIEVTEPNLGRLGSSFVSNIELVPKTTGEEVENYPVEVGGEKRTIPVRAYAADQLEVGEVSLGDNDRPKTKFLTAQKSHTVAWTLVRHQMASFRGSSLGELLGFLRESFASLADDVSIEDGRAIVDQARGLLEKWHDKKIAMHDWQSLVSSLVRLYFIAYQVSESASYVTPTDLGRALGHGEASHMKVLRRNEFSLQAGGGLADSTQRVTQAALKLMDAYKTSTLGSAEIVNVFVHWRGAMRRGFPELMAAGGSAIEGALLNLQATSNGMTFRQVIESEGRGDLLT